MLLNSISDLCNISSHGGWYSKLQDLLVGSTHGVNICMNLRTCTYVHSNVLWNTVLPLFFTLASNYKTIFLQHIY